MKIKTPSFLSLLGVCFALIGTIPAIAANLSFLPGGANPANGGTNTWDTTTASWCENGAGSALTWDNVTCGTATVINVVTNTNGYQVNLSENITVAAMLGSRSLYNPSEVLFASTNPEAPVTLTFASSQIDVQTGAVLLLSGTNTGADVRLTGGSVTLNRAAILSIAKLSGTSGAITRTSLGSDAPWLGNAKRWDQLINFREAISTAPHRLPQGIIEFPVAGYYAFQVPRHPEKIDFMVGLGLQEFQVYLDRNLPMLIVSHWYGLEYPGVTDPDSEADPKGAGYAVHEKPIPAILSSGKARFTGIVRASEHLPPKVKIQESRNDGGSKGVIVQFGDPASAGVRSSTTNFLEHRTSGVSQPYGLETRPIPTLADKIKKIAKVGSTQHDG